MDIGYREDQAKIMEYENGFLAVPSVPGAGKTFMLIELSKKLVAKLEDKKKILILTYMNSAVENIKERLEEFIIDKESFEVMTIHSFAMKILKENHSKVNISDDFLILSDQDKSFYLEKIVNSELNRKDISSLFEGNYNANRVKRDLIRISSSFISFLKLKGINIDEEDGKNVFSNLMRDIYIKYQELISRKSYLDYDDILYISVNLLEKNEILKNRYKNEYQYIIEDESQDSNFIQNRILNLISEDGNLIRFGDMNQSIMGFANSEPKLFRDFANKSMKKEILSAGRSSKEIIDIINYYVKFIKEGHPLEEIRDSLEEQMIEKTQEGELPVNPVMENYGVGAFEFENQAEELDRISDYVGRFREKFPDKTVAVLMSNRYLMSDFAKRLDNREIRYSYLDDVNLREIGALQYIGEILNFIAEPYNRTAFYKVYEILGYKNENIKDIFKEYNIEDIIEFSKKDLEEKTEILSSELESTYDFIKKTKKILSFPKHSLEALVIYISELLKLSVKEMELVGNIVTDVKQLYKINPRLKIKDLSDKLLDLRENRYAFAAKKIFADSEEIKEKLVLTTYHKSKGKEWDAVFLTGLNSDSFPYDYNCRFKGEYSYFSEAHLNPLESLKAEFSNESDFLKKSRKDKIEETVRVLYVGLSRAREYLYLSSNRDKGISLYFKELKDKIETEKNLWKS